MLNRNNIFINGFSIHEHTRDAAVIKYVKIKIKMKNNWKRKNQRLSFLLITFDSDLIPVSLHHRCGNGSCCSSMDCPFGFSRGRIKGSENDVESSFAHCKRKPSTERYFRINSAPSILFWCSESRRKILRKLQEIFFNPIFWLLVMKLRENEIRLVLSKWYEIMKIIRTYRCMTWFHIQS